MTRSRVVRDPGAGESIRPVEPQTALPREFFWRGQRFRVRSVEPGCGTAGAQRLSLKTTSGLQFVLRRDLGGAWTIDRLLSPGGVR